jgi:hypothetical protein
MRGCLIRPARRPKKKLYDPDDDGEVWKHDRFELLDLPPEMDTYQVHLRAPTSPLTVPQNPKNPKPQT